SDLAHKANYLPLPGFQQRRILLDEVEQVLLWLGWKALPALMVFLFMIAGDGAPQIVDLALQIFFPLLLQLTLPRARNRSRTFVTIHTVVHERVACVQNGLYRVYAVAFLTLGNVILREYQIVDDGTGIGPGAE